MAPKKKAAKKLNGKQREDDDIDITFDDDQSASIPDINDAKPNGSDYNVDEEGNELGGLMSLVAQSRASGKQKKAKKGRRHDDDEEDAAEILARIDAEPQIEGKSPITAAKPTQPAPPTNQPSTVPPPAGEDNDDEGADAGGQVHIKSKKEKEREKKERQKLAKKQEAATKAASAASEPKLESKKSNESEPAAAPQAKNAENESEDESGEGTAAASKKKKKPKKKATIPEKEEVKAAPKRKGPAALGALKELLAAKQAAEEESRRQEEEERKRTEEEQRRIEEDERAREEAKRLKKEREKAKKEELKKSGQYLSPAEREKKRQQELKLQQMIAAGLKVAALKETTEGEKKKRVVYGNKRRPAKAKENEAASASSSTVAETETTVVPVEDDSSKQEELAKKEQVEADSKRAAIEAAARAAVEADIAWSLGGPVKSQADSSKSTKADWDESSEEEKSDAESEEEQEATDIKTTNTAATAAVEEPAKLDAKNAQPKREVGKENGAVPRKLSPAAKNVSPRKEEAEEEEEESEEESDEESEDDESDSDGETATQKQDRLRREQAAARRKERRDQALAARSKDDLRSPICCILGHVDTGKTKLLDKIRQTNVQEGEAGGITQQIGATYFPLDAIEMKTALMREEGQPSDYKIPGLLIIDTPGHESFTNLRSRGSSLCNIAILVVDIVHGLEPQTLESIGLLKQRKTPFIVALNKIDRMFDWKAFENYPVRKTLKEQRAHAVKEFEERVRQTQVAFAEQGFNAYLYYENPDTRRNVSIVPTSAITGEGIPDLLNLIVEQTQTKLSSSLMYLSEVECTVLEVKVTEGFGTTIDVVLINGILNEGDRIVLCGLNGPIITNIRALLTPQPMKELRVKGQYVHHKQIKAAMGVKIAAPDLEKAIAGSRLLVCGPDDDEEELKADVMEDLTDLYEYIDKSGKGGVCVQASTLGSLEALLVFLKQSAIPVSGINIGPVFKKDIIRAGVMLERRREYAQLLAFDVPIDRDAQELAEEMGVKIFRADIIYHLFDQFKAYMKEMQEQRRRDDAPSAVFPCHLRMVQGAIFNKRMPIILGMDVLDGSLRIGTPIVAVDAQGQVTKLGRVTGIELNHKAREMVKKGEPSVAVKIDGASYDTPKMYGRHFTDKDDFYSEVTRQSIDILKTTFKSDVSPDEWKLIIKLKKILKI